MKKLSKSKNYIFVIGYWLIFFFIPLIVANVISDATHRYEIPDMIMKVVRYMFYISPILYIIPMRLANLPTIKSKAMFVVWGFIFPIIVMFFLFILAFSQADITLF